METSSVVQDLVPSSGDVDQTVANVYLAWLGGLSFDFGAGQDSHEVAIGGFGSDRLHGSDSQDNLWGRDGDDQLAGGVGDDVVHGDNGQDLLTGGNGRDRLDGGTGDDRLFGAGEADSLHGGDGNDVLDEGVGHGDLDGGAGDDTLIGGQGPDAFMVDRDSGNDVIKDFTAGPGMFDHLALMGLHWSDLSFADTDQGVKISWHGGSVLLEGVMKADLSQDDFMFADQPELPPPSRPADAAGPEAASPSTEGPEIGPSQPDWLQSSFDRFADAFIGRGSLSFIFDDHAVAVGGDAGDSLQGSDAHDHLFGQGGDDHLLGSGGDDVLQGNAGNDALEGQDGMDRVDGGAGDDRLDAGAMPDELVGGDGNDTLDAGDGHDMIEGGPGDDVIRGGTGADAFMVDPGSGNDVVLDFEATGAAQGAFDHIALMEIRPDQVSVADTSGGALVSWDVDGNGQADGSVLLEGVAAADLRQSDFMFADAPGFMAGISTAGSSYIFPPGSDAMM
ncbi:calcium-binding protein [Inquilinus sp. Marseille-Q2685]|uniref:calcium-binding protein n=1 Tax=Inquilinus sp. Marseille-Q2685 TaxID=2866581 RepID=UPI001CE49249|nr:calcium-binding protein [Inquilinus sp. Marseille-Q2685]